MLRRLLLIFLPSLTASVGFANEASWNCEQNKDTKAWVCIGDEKPKVLPKAATSMPIEPVKSIQATVIEYATTLLAIGGVVATPAHRITPQAAGESCRRDLPRLAVGP